MMDTNIAARLGKRPHLLLPAAFAWLRGWWYRIAFRLQGKRFSAGPLFRVYGPLRISGPGEVRFGRNCLIISDAIKPVCIRTLAPEALISLGDGAGLNGTSIQCVQRVEIGELANIADAYITDTAAHTLSRRRREQDVSAAASSPVRIGRNVWISVQVVILHGVTIGENSVIGACSLVRAEVPSDVFGAGNPFRIIRAIDD
jgi:acetyltransferase-like isoleucine patch superfamily enzyme